MSFLRPAIFIFSLAAFTLGSGLVRACAQPEGQAETPDETISFALDMAQQGTPLPKVFYPCVDLSGRGYHADVTWPQTLAAPSVLDCWQKEVGFRGMYRMQFNLWEISQLDKNKRLQERLLANYESVIKRISDSGGTVILDIYSIPQGQGKVLDKKSSSADLVVLKQQIKGYIRHFSCEKKYAIWYEVWSAPDLDDFFLGRKNEYLQLYRCVAEAVKELQSESRCIIPVGGPSASWWFRNLGEGTILTPERSLIYDLIRFCHHNKLPLDFISWHAYTTDPRIEHERTLYNKYSLELIRDWLSYFGFPRETPLIVDEWNFDSGSSNVIEERQAKSNVCASYLLSRLKGMYEAGLDYQVFFSLEDFRENKEGVVRNVGAFWYEPGQFTYSGGSKNVYNAFKMLGHLENSLLPFQQKTADEFSGVIATRGISGFAILAYNYADPEIFRSVVSRGLASLNEAECKSVLAVMTSDKAAEVQSGSADVSALRLSGRVRSLFKRGQELSAAGRRYMAAERPLRVSIKNMASAYAMQVYAIDGACFRDCPFLPVQETVLVPGGDGTSQIDLTLKPYAAALILIRPAPAPAPAAPLVVEVAVNATAQSPAPALQEVSAQPAAAALPAKAEAPARAPEQSPVPPGEAGNTTVQEGKR